MMTAKKQHLVIGTAGHIDHGKTTLVRALTGRDTDSLAQEKERGITIELGFAFYDDRAAFVDVPGHERFVKTMVAGASAMGAAMLIVAADDGVMPQTREHLAVLDAVGVQQGIAVITKAALAENEEWLELVSEEVRELLEPTSLAGSPVVVTDALSGRGMEELGRELENLIERAQHPEDPGFFRMPVDRSFVIKGHGRVVTGTVWSGAASAGDKLMLLPGYETTRVRGLQAHEKEVERVTAGDRAALNLAVETEPQRGDVLLYPGRGVSTEFFDAHVRLLPGGRPVVHRQRVRVHLGTAEVIGRLLIVEGDAIAPGESGLARLALESSLPAMHGDRGVLRLYSPLDTLGGFQVLDPDPPTRRRTAAGLATALKALSGSESEVLYALVKVRGSVGVERLIALLPWSQDKIRELLEALAAEDSVVLPRDGRWVIDATRWEQAKTATLELLEQYHKKHPDEPGMPKGEWGERVPGGLSQEILNELLDELHEKEGIRLSSGRLIAKTHSPKLKKEDREDAGRVLAILRREKLNAPLPRTIADETGLSEERVRSLLRSMMLVGDAVILAENVIITHEIYRQAHESLASAMSDREFTAGEASQALGTTRKYIIPLLEAFDRDGLTVREGDTRRVT
jgi:selenocysteine-specific elongation factor